MQCGLYGKLPAKRDFIAVGVPRGFLDAWEPWLQSVISASRVALRDDWEAAFLKAPIWRFWLGAEHCGEAVIGALMPSTDGIGRYFPLTLVAKADDSAAIPPPEFAAQDNWFSSAEDFLLSALDETKAFDDLLAALQSLPAPSQTSCEALSGDTIVRSADAIVIASGDRSVADIFESIRKTDYDKIYASTTYWWTLGGEEFAPTALCNKRMPDPSLFSAMLTGKFSADHL